MKKLQAIIILIQFIGISVISSTASNVLIKKSSIIYFNGNTLYVGGNESGNYTNIQDAIDNASDDDSIFVYDDSSPYYENIVIDKSIKLQGENRNSTIIDGNNIDDVAYISADNIYISDFTFRNSGIYDFDAGIEIHSNFNTIYNNSICDNGGNGLATGGIFINSSSNNSIKFNLIYQNEYDGIYLFKSDHNYIYNNEIFDNDRLGIMLGESSNNIIEDNDIYKNFCGIALLPYSTHNIIKKNRIYNHPCCGMGIKKYSNYNIIQYNQINDNLAHGIMLGPGPTIRNTVEMNTISGCSGSPWYPNAAIVLEHAYFNTIKNNNIIDNKLDVILNSSFFNLWSKNYWDHYLGFGPKIIVGWVYLPWKLIKNIPWVNIDCFPAKELYETGV
jgi:parallel beta-helix repeat protein